MVNSGSEATGQFTSDRSKGWGVFTLDTEINPINYYQPPYPHTGKAAEKQGLDPLSSSDLFNGGELYFFFEGGGQEKSSESLEYEELREADKGGNAPHPGEDHTWKRERRGPWGTPG